MDTEKKRANEKAVITYMIKSYCKHEHHSKELCSQCRELLDYALVRTDKCPFMATKTFCSACKVHCYEQSKREQIKQVMRSSGPRMLFVHPILLVKHMLASAGGKKS